MRNSLARIVISLFLTTPVFSYTCGMDNFGFLYTCCAQYKCAAGVGIKCSSSAPPGTVAHVTGAVNPVWNKAYSCDISTGWQASTICTIPLGNSLVTTAC